MDSEDSTKAVRPKARFCPASDAQRNGRL